MRPPAARPHTAAMRQAPLDALNAALPDPDHVLEDIVNEVGAALGTELSPGEVNMLTALARVAMGRMERIGALVRGQAASAGAETHNRESLLTVDQLAAENRVYRLVVERSSEVATLLNLDFSIAYISPACRGALGYAPEELTGVVAMQLLHPDDHERIPAFYTGVLAGRSSCLTHRLRRKTGEYVWFETQIHPVRDEKGDVTQALTFSRDITDRKRLEGRLAHQAYHDPLTRLPNRAAFMERLDRALAVAAGRQETVAVLFLDLDNFQVINNSLGHEVGDQVLMAAAQRLRSCLRPQDTVARFSGDEFTILLEEIAGAEAATGIAEQINAALQAPFDVGGQEVFVSGSIGIATGAGGGAPDLILRDADLAMDWAKNSGRATYQLYNSGMRERALERLQLDLDLRRAIDRSEFTLHYQPVVSLRTGRVQALEALVRWVHPTRGLVYPADFIPLAEETGLILPLGRWVLAEACRQAQGWQEDVAGGPPPIVSVNLSSRQFQDPNLLDTVTAVLAQTGLAPSRLQLEVTESLMLADPVSVATLRQLSQLGVRIALDDFGTGYSSLGYLRRFPIHVLKIDRSFVQDLGHNPESTAIVQAIIMVARSLNLTVIGEGVETADQMARLKDLGCDGVQGYFLARPAAAPALQVILPAPARRRRHRKPQAASR